jgi:hypothetical protein
MQRASGAMHARESKKRTGRVGLEREREKKREEERACARDPFSIGHKIKKKQETNRSIEPTDGSTARATR